MRFPLRYTSASAGRVASGVMLVTAFSSSPRNERCGSPRSPSSFAMWLRASSSRRSALKSQRSSRRHKRLLSIVSASREAFRESSESKHVKWFAPRSRTASSVISRSAGASLRRWPRHVSDVASRQSDSGCDSSRVHPRIGGNESGLASDASWMSTRRRIASLASRATMRAAMSPVSRVGRCCTRARSSDTVREMQSSVSSFPSPSTTVSMNPRLSTTGFPAQER
mmetsp:Transcript_50479/g.155960  ORF Transcript_50479/g.155960 Transcript_50479/m.155960 type:complete len:225 (-) Transcript_50479:1668-2342(-)